MNTLDEHGNTGPETGTHQTPGAPRTHGWRLALPLEARTLIGPGLFWMTVGLAVVPGRHAESVYHWILGVFLFAPALWLLVRERAVLARRWWTQPALRGCLVLLVWSGITLLWAQGAHVSERIKVPIFILLYLTGWMAWAGQRPRPERVLRLLHAMALGLAVAAVAAMLTFPWRPVRWTGERMFGLGMLDGPNLSAYVMGLGFVILSQLRPSRRLPRAAWMAALVTLAVFVAWTGCRSAWLAILACLVVMSILRRERLGWVLAASGVVAALAVAVVAPAEWFQRGLSYRPQILARALQRIEHHPLGGLGMGTRYLITVGERSWTHSHNLFSNVAIEAGLPAFVLWVGLWLWTGWTAWRTRQTRLGGMLLAIWIFASVALQFDGPSLLNSPRPEWPLTWMPVALAVVLGPWHARAAKAPPAPDRAAG